MMGLGQNQIKYCLILVLCLTLFTALSASTFISDVISGSPVLSQRRLLQAKKDCPISFEFQNYTVFSKCKGPDYMPKPCCSAFKEFACPFADDLNDLTNNCAVVMFSYINIHGKYPDGLFASLCREGKEGLACPATPPSPSSVSQRANKNRGNQIICELLPVVMLNAASLVLSLQLE